MCVCPRVHSSASVSASCVSCACVCRPRVRSASTVLLSSPSRSGFNQSVITSRRRTRRARQNKHTRRPVRLKGKEGRDPKTEDRWSYASRLQVPLAPPASRPIAEPRLAASNHREALNWTTTLLQPLRHQRDLILLLPSYYLMSSESLSAASTSLLRGTSVV